MVPLQAASIGVGTAAFLPHYGLNSIAQSDASHISILRAAVNRGVSYIDTAPSYGRSECLLGELADLLQAHQVRLCTKIAVKTPSLTGGAIVAAVETSLSRLHRGSVDTLLLHSATGRMICDSVIPQALEHLKREGRTGRTGVSTYGLEDARLALAMPWCDVLQVEYSIFNQSVGRAIVPEKRDGQELVVRSVLCKGLLTERRRYAPDPLRQLNQTPDELERVADGWGYSLPELAIRFALDTPGIDVVLVGVSTHAELDLAWRVQQRASLSPDQMEILQRFDRSELDGVHPERWS